MNIWAATCIAEIHCDRLHQRLLSLAAACCTCILMSPVSSAQQNAGPAQAQVVASAAPADLGYGDYVHLNEPTAFSQLNPADMNQAATTVCLKPHVKLQFVRSLTSTSGDRAGTTVLEFKRKVRHTLKRKANDLLNVDCSSKPKELGSPAADFMVYRVDQDKLPKEYYEHMGITHGALLVPFKRRPDKTLSGETSLGYFFGYRFDTVYGITVTPIVTAGMSLVNVSSDSAITPTSTLQDSGVRAAFTYGAGLIFTHLGSFQVGAVYGWDKIGGDAGKAWKYEGKGWSSLMVGYAFTR